MSSEKPFLLVYGATGATGNVVVEGLLQSGAFRLGVISRSESTPRLKEWQGRGIVLRTIDVGSASPAALEETLQGVDILLSICTWNALETQRPLLDAAKKAGVRRVVPSDFGPACPPGVTHMQDVKLGIREHVRALGLTHTFVEIGWWAQLALPYPDGVTDEWSASSRIVYGDGETKSAVTDLARVPELLVRILQDPRTENKTVFCWEDEVTQNEAWAIAVREAPEGSKLLESRVNVPVEQFQQQLAAAEDTFDKDPTPLNRLILGGSQYSNTLYVRGDNTVAKAVAAGALNARDLYPDFAPKSLADFAKGWYRTSPVLPRRV